MKHDKGLWIIVAILLMLSFATSFFERQFTASNSFTNPDVVHDFPNSAEVPQATRVHTHYVVDTKVDFLELKVKLFIKKMTTVVELLVFIAFIFLAVRQFRLTKRIEKLEADLQAITRRPQLTDAPRGAE